MLKTSKTIIAITASIFLLSACSSSPKSETSNTPDQQTNSTSNQQNNTSTLNPEITKCQDIQDPAEQDNCVQEARDASEKARAQSEQKDLDTYLSATNSSDPTKCQTINNEVIKQQCLSSVIQANAVAARDASICDQDRDEESKAGCKRQVQIMIDADKIDPNNSDKEKASQ